MPPKSYRWNYPQDWLNDKLTEWSEQGNIAEILAIARELAAVAGDDEIQNRFESEMDADGFFEPFDEEKEAAQ